MKVLIFAVFLILIIPSSGEETLPPYNVSCTDGQSATITVNKGYSFGSKNNICPIVTNDGSRRQNFQLTPICLSPAELVVEMIPGNELMPGSIITSPERHVFTITCKEDDGKIYSVTKTIAGSAATTHKETFKYHTADRIELIIVRDPSPSSEESFDDLTKRDLVSANIGERLFLAVVATATVDTMVVPINCSAEILNDESTLTTLWNLDAGHQCIQESKVVKSTFRPGETNNHNHFSYLEMTAFHYYRKEGSDITLSCKVRVCRSASGKCDEDKVTLDGCNSVSNGKRRRREVNDGPANDDMHHVTATLRIMGTGGSTTLTYTLPCLLISLLAKIIL